MLAPTSATASSTTGWASCLRPPWARSGLPSGSSRWNCAQTRTRALRLPCATRGSRMPTASWGAV
eukprot:9026972-Alexandrium_andersonii.AAC.1